MLTKKAIIIPHQTNQKKGMYHITETTSHLSSPPTPTRTETKSPSSKLLPNQPKNKQRSHYPYH